jgi:hypothetical protein
MGLTQRDLIYVSNIAIKIQPSTQKFSEGGEKHESMTALLTFFPVHHRLIMHSDRTTIAGTDIPDGPEDAEIRLAGARDAGEAHRRRAGR